MGWPENWQEQINGDECRGCDEGRPDVADDPARIRFFAGEVSDAYLMPEAVQRGWVIVIWRGRHVIEPTELTSEEFATYGSEVMAVARAVQAHFKPMKLNFQTLGNQVPHLHTNVIARFRDDVAPGEDVPPGRLFGVAGERPLPEAEWRADLEALRQLMTADAR